MTDEQLDLFSIAPAVRGQSYGEPERRPPAVRKTLVQKPTWSYYAGTHTPCAEHVRRRHEGSLPDEGAIPPARYRRTLAGESHHLCTECAIHWRQLDGCEPGLPSSPARKK